MAIKLQDYVPALKYGATIDIDSALYSTLEVQNEDGDRALVIDQNGNGASIRIESSATTSSESVLSIIADSSTTQTAISVSVDSITSGRGMLIHSTSSGFTGDGLLRVIVDDASASGSVISIKQDGTGSGIDLTDMAAGTPTIDFPAGNASTIDPSTTAETGWLNIAVDGTVRYVPFYAAS